MVDIYFYNSISGRKEKFIPVDKSSKNVDYDVGMYVCGPTVYDKVHLGNARPAVVFDVVYRLLSLFYKVKYVRNITDVDDKIITAAKKNNESIESLTQRTIKQYHEDMRALGVNSPSVEPRATEHIPDMIAMIEKLIELGYAYVAEGHVLFSVNKKRDYGVLSKRSVDEMIAGARVEVAPYKKDPADFVLWKPAETSNTADANSGNDNSDAIAICETEAVAWDSPWGKGRPGWHIECSAMIKKHLGESFDIHGGGRDLIFPHHENELAQSSACCSGYANANDSSEGQCFAKYWIHNGMLTVDGQKMSKSLGNFLTVADALAKYRGEVLRYFLLSSHYRQALDLNDQIIHQAELALDKFYGLLRQKDLGDSDGENIDQEFLSALCDDLNTPRAISRLHQLAKLGDVKGLKASANLLGLLQRNPDDWFAQKEKAKSAEISPKDIEDLLQQRLQAKQDKDYQRADEIRDLLKSKGVQIKDSKEGTTWEYI